MFQIEPEILENLNPLTLLILEKSRINTTTIITQTIINKVALNALNHNNYKNTEKQTKINCFLNLKQIIYVIGLIKRELEKNIALSARVSLTAKLVSLLFKINDIINKYNLSVDNLQEIFDEAYDELILAEDTNNKYFGITTTQNLLNTLIKKIIVNNNTETDISIKDSVNLDTYLKLKVIRYVINNYQNIVNPQTQADSFLLLKNILSTTTNFINNMVEKIELIKFYDSADPVVQKLIRRNVNKNYLKAMFDVETL
jgi:hypothetical protein